MTNNKVENANIVGGQIPGVRKIRRAIKYRNKAGKDHVIDMIENISNNPVGMKIRDINDCLSNIGVVTSIEEAPLEDVVGGASLADINDRRFDSIWKKKDPRKIVRLFKNADGSIKFEAAASPASIEIANAVRQILNEMSMPEQERLLLAGILLSDDELDLEDLLARRN